MRFKRQNKAVLDFIFLGLIYLAATEVSLGQENDKSYEAFRITSAPKIDGIFESEVWDQVPIASNFVMFKPGDGTPVRETHRTEVKIAYNDEAVFVAAYLFDNQPDRIHREFAQRDNIPAADYFVVDLNTYRDGENQTRFIITSAGTLADAKMKGVNEDYSYDVVWEGEARITKDGWVAELKIPFSALRFSQKEEQIWGLQFGREISHLNEIYVWNYVNKEKGNYSHYNGILKNLKDVDPPIRLSFYPYVFGGIESYESKESHSLSAGLDLKYGINEAFTLDVTLVPDFGQTAYDEVELNLGPFEQTFDEKRAFFTEGIELFSKGNLFYSRRIGGVPLNYNLVQNQLLPGEQLEQNPSTTQLINALKISGRTENGLGIGFFNAITEATRAVIKNPSTGTAREVITQPLSNYNIFVLDQQIFGTSSISLINTNVTRVGGYRDSNVSGFLFDLYNRSNTFNFNGEAKMSAVNMEETNLTGFASTFSVLRTAGKFRYGLTHDFANETYDINDLGISQATNYNNFFWNTSYRVYEPNDFLSQYSVKLYGNHQRQYNPNMAVRTGIGTSFSATTTERFSFGGFIDVNSKYRDFFESRRNGREIIYNPNYIADLWVSSDFRKALASDFRIGYSNFLNSDQEKLTLTVTPRFRFSDKATLTYIFKYLKEVDRKSFLTLLPHDIIFGNRDRESVENALRLNYIFNTKASINLSFRNFWSAANFSKDSFLKLEKDGYLTPMKNYSIGEVNPDINFNIWNLDLSYQWRFAPGSEVVLLYRNSVFNQDDRAYLDYFQSVEDLFLEPIKHSLSLKVVYYLDYNAIVKLL